MGIGSFFNKGKKEKEVKAEVQKVDERISASDKNESTDSNKNNVTGKLAYKTRGNSSPQGKQKVYFCCHPKDFGKLFDKISDEILERQNCAIWYDANQGNACDEDFLDGLAQMQLFVIPVTTRFLTTENKALQVEFAFAMEHHIPVLPLIQEPRLVQIFNQTCGNLQFLNAFNNDATAISYEENLDRFLQNVLVGDDLVQKIRDAFDGYIFLSYRKKDRKYAQSLMREIHKNEFCQNIAIWYDEFLVPGEDFSDAIQDALKKSGLFVLTVTPNLIDEENYIMSTEYPLACKEEKRILPVEMLATSKEKLSERYPNLPTVVSVRSKEELSNELLSCVKTMVEAGQNYSPEKDFYIGLAYHGGVDVEVDCEKAVALITKAADAGVAAAAKKLVQMYRNGSGVGRDYEKALLWQQKVVDLQKDEYEKLPSEESADQYLQGRCVLGQQYVGLGKNAEALEEYEKTLQAAKEFAAQYDGWNVQRYVFECERRLGDLYRKDQNFEEAREHYETFYNLMKERLEERTALAEESDEIDIDSDKTAFISSIANLAELARDEEDLETALEYYEELLELAKEQVQETDNLMPRRNLAAIHGNIGEILEDDGYLFEAREHHLKSLKILEQVVKESKDAFHKRDVLVSLDNLTQSYMAEGDCRTAEKYAQKSLALAKELVSLTETISSKFDLAISYKNLGDLKAFEGNKMEAMSCYEEVVKIKEEIDASTKTAFLRYT